MAVIGLFVTAGMRPQQIHIANEQVVPIGQRCPGALRVQHQPFGGATVWTVAQEDKPLDRQARNVPGPGVHVEFDGVGDVKTLEFTVSYVPAGVRVMPIEPGKDSNRAKLLKKTFVLQPEPARQIDADLLVGPAAMIKRVHIVSVTFSDGNFWRASSDEECSVPPALYMPVQGKK